MTRSARLARLLAHRAREVDDAMRELERARTRTRQAHAAIGAADDAIRDARTASITMIVAGELADHSAHVRTLVARRARAVMNYETMQRAETSAQQAVVRARMEQKKLEMLIETLNRVQAEAEERAMQRTTDDFVGARRARQSA